MSDGRFPSANEAKSTFLLFDKSSTFTLGKSLLKIAVLAAAFAAGFAALGVAFAFALVAANALLGEATIPTTETAATRQRPRRSVQVRKWSSCLFLIINNYLSIEPMLGSCGFETVNGGEAAVRNLYRQQFTEFP